MHRQSKISQHIQHKEICLETNATYEALKLYRSEGLVPNVKRDANNHRVFDDCGVAWIKSLICLKNCGISIHEMKEYIALCLKGESTILKRKRAQLVELIAEVQASIDYIDWKQGFDDGVLAGKTKYFSNLINT